MNTPDITFILSIQLAVAVVIAVIARRLRIPLTVILVLAGFIVASLTGLEIPLEGDHPTDVIIFLFLPVLVYEAAISLNPRTFLRDLNAILVLAIPSVIIASLLIGGTLHYGFGMAMATALLFGVLISATDPVAVTAVFRELGVPNRLLTIVEGESLLNDGVAIALFNIVLIAALGGSVSVSQGVIEFIKVFFGGIAVGFLIGLAFATVLPWLDRLPAAALSMAVAYGGFALSEHVLGVSGVMTTVAIGQTVAGLGPSRASLEVRQTWHEMWDALGFITNALLFLLIGTAISGELLVSNIGMILAAIVVVLAARIIAILPLVSILERFSKISTINIQSQAVLIWGGLRGGVALALALALPEALPERNLLIAMTGGVVLATLLINATTISSMVRWLGMDELRHVDQVLAGGAALSGISVARQRLEDLGIEDQVIAAEMDRAERSLRSELQKIPLTDEEERSLVTLSGLHVERETYLHLHDVGLIQPSVTRRLLNEVEDQIEEVSIGHFSDESLERGKHPFFDGIFQRVFDRLPDPKLKRPIDLIYDEATARQVAARRVSDTLDLLAHLPNISDTAVAHSKELFRKSEAEALSILPGYDEHEYHLQTQRRRQALAVSQLSSTEILNQLTSVGLLPEIVARRAAQTISNEVTGNNNSEVIDRQGLLHQVRAGLPVVTTDDSQIGYVHQVQGSGAIVPGFIVRYGLSGLKRKHLTIETVQEVTDEAVILNINQADFHQLPDIDSPIESAEL